MKLIEQIEAFKRMGMYAVTVSYGSTGVGCDDMDIPIKDRAIKLIGVPVGSLGEGRVIYSGTIEALLKTDLSKMSIKILENPPSANEKIEIEHCKGDLFGFGTKRAVENIKKDYNG